MSKHGMLSHLALRSPSASMDVFIIAVVSVGTNMTAGPDKCFHGLLFLQDNYHPHKKTGRKTYFLYLFKFHVMRHMTGQKKLFPDFDFSCNSIIQDRTQEEARKLQIT